ncbi:hypothetical protein E1H45_19630 (plasmid) [Clostridioides difficile]|uniref:hypothetical protein n=1 Tax=Clostridioides difficile TaxID=1496 RepID=UPI000975C4F2|nr:hypothetical protein [Clostridioides difficile]MBS1300518.1 hypothetical protein [Clostridioides difficile]MBY1695154.1 hypothetical protein [Clostridioides difficile]MBY2049350.1 hypothetical protein [Clostridioides difficile]MCW0769412.1 hypothetical protein [Clostridioides difficile]MDB6298930.1 hypothetical protein [Clostridioides difficile]
MSFDKKRLICAGDFLIELDEAIADIIIELNKKGYKTLNCCSGHINNDGETNCYISFYESYNFTLPKNYCYESDNLIRCNFYGNKLELKKQLNQNIEILRKWVNGLQTYNQVIGEIRSRNENKKHSYIKCLNKDVRIIKSEISEIVSMEIDKLDINSLKVILKEIGIKNYSKLKKNELLIILNENLDILSNEDRKEVLYWIYENNKIKFGMFQKEVIEYLNISKGEFNKVSNELKDFEIGIEKLRIGGKMQSYIKYDRMKIYNIFYKAL